MKDQVSLDNHMKNHKEHTIKCRICNQTFDSDKDLRFHKTYEHQEKTQWNCMDCSFQTNNKSMLRNHLNFKHTKDNDKQVFGCDKCERQFSYSWSLKNHTRDDHGKTEECVFYKVNKCKFGQTCWKLHNENTNKDSFICFSCNDGFKTMNSLMSHRKKDHIDLCKPCQPKNGNCRFENNIEKCWFVHQNFQEVMKKHNPPLRENQPRVVEQESNPSL